jgi:predicted RNase H-like HicB family nuclease
MQVSSLEMPPGFPGAHTQGRALDELHANLQEVIAMLLENGEPKLEAEFAGIRTVPADSGGLLGSR